MIDDSVKLSHQITSAREEHDGQENESHSWDGLDQADANMPCLEIDDPDVERWLNDFQRLHGRPPRILHIGNIANNAYLNAKILNQRGFDCDVVCYDYYHVMGYPEWEEADLITAELDHFAPKWTNIDLGDYERPRWFVQGPHELCLKYLLAKRGGMTRETEQLWASLMAYWSGKKVSSERAWTKAISFRTLAKWIIRDEQSREDLKARELKFRSVFGSLVRQAMESSKRTLVRLVTYLNATIKGERTPIEDFCYSGFRHARSWLARTQNSVFGALDNENRSALIRHIRSLSRSAEHKADRWIGRPLSTTDGSVVKYILRRMRVFVEWYRSQSVVLQALLVVPLLPVWILFLLVNILRMIRKAFAHLFEGEENDVKAVRQIEHNVDRLQRRADEMAEYQQRMFPDRDDIVCLTDIVSYASIIDQWSLVLDQYDLVIGYATDGILPLLCEKRPYIAFEHGTIRSIPFEHTSQGRLCALTYRSADRSLITNCDNIDAAQRLELDNYCFIPHPINEDLQAGEAAHDLRARLEREYDTDFIVFHPARQHWEEARHPSWEKGNDVLIRGFADFVNECCPHALAVFVEWGATVDATKDLLSECGISDHVKWIEPVPNRGMIEYILASDVIADQFYLGAFGSLTPKALLHGRPVMLKLDEARHRWCFPEMPPVLNTSTPAEAAQHLQRLYEDSDYNQKLCLSGKQWYQKYHSNDEIARVMGGQAAAVLKVS